MKVFILIMFVGQLYAQTDVEGDFISLVQEKAVEKQIIESDEFKNCKESFPDDKTEMNNCLNDNIKNLEDEKIEALADKMNIEVLEQKLTKTPQNLKEYLQKRIFNAIHGPQAWEKRELKHLKFVDQRKFLDLYESQISKNILIDLSTYCLENLGPIDDVPSGSAKDDRPTKGVPQGYLAFASVQNTLVAKDIIAVLNYDPTVKKYQKKTPTVLKSLGGIQLGDKKLWSYLTEYRFCNRLETDPNKKEDPCYYKSARDADMVKALKDYELEAFKGDQQRQLLGQKWGLCSVFFLPKMCEIYRCNNTYNLKGNSQSEIDKAKECKDDFGITANQVTSNQNALYDIKNKKGQIACQYTERIEVYKKTLKAIEEMKKEYDKLKTKGGLAFALSGLKDIYSGGDPGTSIDDLTSISSKELANGVDVFKKNVARAKELEDLCFKNGVFQQDNKDCMKLTESLKGDSVTKMETEAETETKLYLEKLNRLKKQKQIDKEELDKLKQKHGLAHLGQIDQEELLSLIEEKYKKERASYINSLKDRYYQIKKQNEKNADKDQVLANIAEEKVSDLKSYKDRIETLFNYTNIVTSYLETKEVTTDPKKQAKGSMNARPRLIEEKGFDQFADPKDKNKYEAEKELYQSYFDDPSGEKDVAKAGQSTIKEDLLDKILSIPEKDPNGAN